MERRFIKGATIRAVTGDKPGIAGIAAVYDQSYEIWQGFVENVARGAFSRALKEKQDVRCLFNHDVNQLLGRSKPGTLRLADSTEGLGYECDTDPDTTVGRDVVRMIERGDIDGCSFSFDVTAQSWRDEKDPDSGLWITYRTIEDVNLYDVGPVTFPAYTETSVGIRSQWPEGVPGEVRAHVRSIPKLFRDARTRRDDDCQCDCDPCSDGNCEDCGPGDCGDSANCRCERSKIAGLELRARSHMHAA